MNAGDFPDHLFGPFGKLREYLDRFTLICAMGRWASSGASGLPTAEPVDVEAAWALLVYFKRHLRRVLAHDRFGGRGEAGTAARAIHDWIVEHRPEKFTERDISQARRWIGRVALRDGLELLVKAGEIRPVRQEQHSGPGRPSSPEFEVNPALFVG